MLNFHSCITLALQNSSDYTYSSKNDDFSIIKKSHLGIEKTKLLTQRSYITRYMSVFSLRDMTYFSWGLKSAKRIITMCVTDSQSAPSSEIGIAHELSN